MMPSETARDVAMMQDWWKRQSDAKEYDKSFTDKLLGREDSLQLLSLMQKDNLTRQDFAVILNTISGINTKLVNFNEWDRYVIGFFFTRVRDICKNSMMTIEEFINCAKFIKFLQQKLKAMEESPQIIVEKTLKVQVEYDGFTWDDRLQRFLPKKVDMNIVYLEELHWAWDEYHNLLTNRNINSDEAKSLIDVFLFMENSTMSLGAAAFDTLSQQRFEVTYPGQENMGLTQLPEQKKHSLLFWRKR